MMIVCYGLGSFMVCVDLARVPVLTPAAAGIEIERKPLFSSSIINQDYRNESIYSLDTTWRVQNREYGRQTWGFCLGDGEVTALENILIWLPLLFGFMRTVDFLRADYDENKENAWNDFLIYSEL